jgi:hypothetical protein
MQQIALSFYWAEYWGIDGWAIRQMPQCKKTG